MKRLSFLSLACAASLAMGASPAPTADPNAVAAVRAYVAALRTPDADAAFALLTASQQRYFGNARNFGSDLSTTGYRVVASSIARSVQRNAALVEVDVDQTVTYLDVGEQAPATARLTEPYFALKSGTDWRVKELYQPWKSYAPKAVGHAGPLEVEVDRVAFYDHRMQIYCTLRDVGAQAVQVLPLLRSTLAIDGGATQAAMSQASFPLNDQQFFEGVRVYPEHQVVGWINFPLPSRADADMTLTLKVSPAIVDGASGPMTVTVGPMRLPRW